MYTLDGTYTFDMLLMFQQHAMVIRTSVSERNRVISFFAETTYGRDKETFVTTYKTFGGQLLTVLPQSGPSFFVYKSNQNAD